MNATALSDTDLVAQILAGQRDAFAVLVERHLHSALAIARARLLNPADADDAVQEAFLRAYRGLRTLREPAKFGPWLLTIARHEAARLVVKGRSTLGADPAGAPDLAAAAEPEPLRAELHAQLRDHIANLPETAREVLLLHYFAGRTTREIAALLDIRQGAVLKRLQRARESLAETLLRDLETERPSRDALNKKAVHIAALTAGLAIQQTATASAASIAAALLVPKAATIAAGFVGAAVTIGSISAFVWQTRGHEISASQVHEVATVDDTGTQRSSASKRPALPNAARAQNASNQRPTSSNGAAGNGDTTDVQARPEPTKNTAFPGQSGPSGSVTLKFENAHISEVLAYIQNETGVQFLIDRRAVGVPAKGGPAPAPVIATRPYPTTGRVHDVHIRAHSVLDALDQVLEPAGLKAVLAPGYWWISTPEQVRRDGKAYPRTEYERFPRLEKIEEPRDVNLNFGDVHISEVLQYLEEIYGIEHLGVDWRVIARTQGPSEFPVFAAPKVSDGVIRYIRVKNISLEVALRILARMTNLVLCVRKDYLWLTSEEMMQRDGIVALSPEERRGMEKILASPITIEFEEVSLSDVLNFIEEIYEVNVAVDQRPVVWKNEPLAVAPAGPVSKGSGDVTHGMLRFLRAPRISLQSALEIVTRDLGLAYAVRNDAVIVSTRKTLDVGGPAWDDLVMPDEMSSGIEKRTETPRTNPKKSAAETSTPPTPVKISPPRLITIRKANVLYYAQIDTGLKVGWYREGVSFEEYTVTSIDPVHNSVELHNDKTNQRQFIFLERLSP